MIEGRLERPLAEAGNCAPDALQAAGILTNLQARGGRYLTAQRCIGAGFADTFGAGAIVVVLAS